MVRKIATYCRQEAEGWDKFPAYLVPSPPGEEDLYCGFMRKDGAHMMASVKDYGRLQTIHVSIGPIYSLRPDLTPEELKDYLFSITPEVIETFFGERRFAKQPDDPRKPDVKHYFSVLEVGE